MKNKIFFIVLIATCLVIFIGTFLWYLVQQLKVSTPVTVQKQKIEREEKKNMAIKKLFEIPKEHGSSRTLEPRFVFSPDYQHFAYWVATEDTSKKSFVVLDGKEQKKYDNIGLLIFSPDSKHFAYLATTGSEKFFVLDGVEQKKYGTINFAEISSPTFSPDSKHFAYDVFESGSFIVLDGVELKKGYVSTSDIIFSPDSKRFAYQAVYGTTNKGKSFFVLDGVKQEIEQKEYNSIDFPVFSPDSKHFAYRAAETDSDGRSIGYSIVFNGVAQKKYDEILIADEGFEIPLITFSPDSKHFAYLAKTGGEKFFVLDGVEQKKYQFVRLDSPIFSPNSEHFIYKVNPTSLAFIDSTEEKKSFLVIDGKEQKKYDPSTSFPLPFSHFSSLFPPIDALTFSPDSQRFVYVAATGKGSVIVLNGKAQKKYYWRVTSPTFSLNSKHLAYIATSQSEKNGRYTFKDFVVLDGVEQKKYDEIIAKPKFIENNLYYIGKNDREIFLTFQPPM